MAWTRWAVGAVVVLAAAALIRDAAYGIADAIRYRADLSRYEISVGEHVFQMDRKDGKVWLIQGSKWT